MMTESNLTKVRASGPHEQVQIIPELQADETAKEGDVRTCTAEPPKSHHRSEPELPEGLLKQLNEFKSYDMLIYKKGLCAKTARILI